MDSLTPVEFQTSMNFPFTMGIYLAVNTIPDAYLVMDEPNCVFFKAEHVYKNHDLFSTLLSAHGYHRISQTGLNSADVSLDHDPKIKHALRSRANHPGCNLVLLCSLPMVSITGVQYDLIIREVQTEKLGAPILEIPSRSLTMD